MKTKDFIKEGLLDQKEKNVCPICGKEYEGFGNNAYPVYEGRCCDECNNNIVVPMRIAKIKGLNPKLVTAYKVDKSGSINIMYVQDFNSGKIYGGVCFKDGEDEMGIIRDIALSTKMKPLSMEEVELHMFLGRKVYVMSGLVIV